MEDIQEGFIRVHVFAIHCIFTTSVVEYGRTEHLKRITQGREKIVHTLLIENLKERDGYFLITNPMQKSPV
jgi:hypothetical protein